MINTIEQLDKVKIPPQAMVLINKVLENEGVYSDVANDSGGRTMYGISEKHNSWLWKVRVPTYDDAQKIAYSYYLHYHIDEIPALLQPNVLDSVFMSGRNGIKTLQRAISREVYVKDDGYIGSKTLKALGGIEALRTLNNSIVDERIDYYKKIVLYNQSQTKFLNGWINRAEKFREVV